MQSLSEILLSGPHKDALRAACVRLIEGYVAQRSGLKGMAYRTGLGLLEKAKPGILPRATAKLLPAFLKALEPLHREYQAQGADGFASFLERHQQRAADALLGVADRMAGQGSETVRKTYGRFRGGAEDEARALVPGLGRVIQAYLPARVA